MTRLNDGGADQDLNHRHRPCDCITSLRAAPPPFSRGPRRCSASGMRRFMAAAALLDGLHPVVEVVHLARPAASSRRMASSSIPLGCTPAHRSAPGTGRLGGCLDGGHVPQSRTGPCSGSGEWGWPTASAHPLPSANLLEPLLVGHAKALLLVHHQKPQVLELDAPSASSLWVPTDHVQGRRPRRSCERLLLLGGRAEPAEARPH